MKKYNPDRWLPLGIDAKKEVSGFLIVLACAVVFSFGWFFNFFSELSELYHYDYKTASYVLLEYKTMPRFPRLLGISMNGFPALAIAVLLRIVYHYMYHRQGSKSIYLMRRLPNRFELHRRCIVLSAVEAGLTLLVGGLLLGIYFLIYITVTPDQCLNTAQWTTVWRLF